MYKNTEVVMFTIPNKRAFSGSYTCMVINWAFLATFVDFSLFYNCPIKNKTYINIKKNPHFEERKGR